MKGFIFHEIPPPFPEICGSTLINDLIIHLKQSGVSDIYCDSEENFDGVTSSDFESAKKHLGKGWLAAYSGSLSRQSPGELKELTLSSGADIGISLACSAKPWEHTTILTDGKGFVERTEKNPPPENAETNLCFSGLVWVATEEFNPREPLEVERASAFLLPGFWMRPDSHENYLLTVHRVLRGEAEPWPHLHIPDNGIITHSRIPACTEINGTLWAGTDCTVENGCTLENCVLLDGSVIGANSNLRNCLVTAGRKIPRNTLQYDKYLSLPGDDYGREH